MVALSDVAARLLADALHAERDARRKWVQLATMLARDCDYNTGVFSEYREALRLAIIASETSYNAEVVESERMTKAQISTYASNTSKRVLVVSAAAVWNLALSEALCSDAAALLLCCFALALYCSSAALMLFPRSQYMEKAKLVKDNLDKIEKFAADHRIPVEKASEAMAEAEAAHKIFMKDVKKMKAAEAEVAAHPDGSAASLAAAITGVEVVRADQPLTRQQHAQLQKRYVEEAACSSSAEAAGGEETEEEDDAPRPATLPRASAGAGASVSSISASLESATISPAKSGGGSAKKSPGSISGRSTSIRTATAIESLREMLSDDTTAEMACQKVREMSDEQLIKLMRAVVLPE